MGWPGPQAQKPPDDMMRLLSSPAHPDKGQLHFSFSSLQASSGAGKQGNCLMLQTIAIFEI